MVQLKVEGMTCQHCVSAVRTAVQSVEPGALVEIDLAAGTVAVTGTAPTARLTEAVQAAGYAVVTATPA